MSNIRLQAREFLSTHSEKHAAIIGFVLVFTLGKAGLLLVVATALGLKGYQKIGNGKAARELKKEPWYGLAAGFLGFVVRNLDVVLQNLPL